MEGIGQEQDIVRNEKDQKNLKPEDYPPASSFITEKTLINRRSVISLIHKEKTVLSSL
jgi:hypothetical protein